MRRAFLQAGETAAKKKQATSTKSKKFMRKCDFKIKKLLFKKCRIKYVYVVTCLFNLIPKTMPPNFKRLEMKGFYSQKLPICLKIT